MFQVPEQFRVSHPIMGGTKADGNNGLFVIPFESYELQVIASDGGNWEHVSVSMKNRTPSWKQMCFIKDLFWGEDDTVIQYHPAKSEYVNNHEHCLHLWRPLKEKLPTPPSIFVGTK